MNKQLWLALALSASLTSWGLHAEDTQSSGASSSGGMSFNSLDQDKDGTISKSEAKKDKTLSSEFKTVDADGDGKLSETEFQGYAAGASGSGSGGSSGGSSQ